MISWIYIKCQRLRTEPELTFDLLWSCSIHHLLTVFARGSSERKVCHCRTSSWRSGQEKGLHWERHIYSNITPWLTLNTKYSIFWLAWSTVYLCLYPCNIHFLKVTDPTVGQSAKAHTVQPTHRALIHWWRSCDVIESSRIADLVVRLFSSTNVS